MINMARFSLSEQATLDFTHAWIEPVVKIVLSLVSHVQQDVLWSLVYISVLAVTYLFHSPFRAHSAATLDTYARVTRVLQSWCTLVVVCFHMLPKIFKQKQLQLASVSSTEDCVGMIFFPMFFSLSCFFLLMHKWKRSLRLGITYGGNMTAVMLNSIVLTVLSLMHFSYCDHVFRVSTIRKGTTMIILRSMFMFPLISQHPFRVLARLFSTCVVFVCLDYMYKRRKGFDPTSGILWSDFFEMQKERRFSQRHKKEEKDWRLLERKPYVFRKELPTKGCVPVPANLTASGALAADAQLRNTSLEQHAYQDDTSFMTEGMSFSSPTVENMVSIDRRAPCSFLDEQERVSAQEAKHPLNRPGMVPWWSTFVLATAWQAFAGTMLGFLSFDIRYLQTQCAPKIFKLNFSTKLANIIGKTVSPSRDSGSSPRHREQTSTPTQATPASSTMPNVSAISVEECDTDVWFDWIADVGDGFNPTYEMARLLAQPSIKVNTGKNSALNSKRSAADIITPTETMKELSLEASQIATSSPAYNLKRRSSWTYEDGSEEKKGKDNNSGGGASGTLPRGSFVLVGGDLAYPNPSPETYESRLFGPYSDALRGSRLLRRMFHERQHDLVVPDPADKDVAHIHMLDACTASRIARGGDTLRPCRASAEEALRTVPMLFAIPGNHDWFDGLRTFSNYIIEKTWLGGWLMPQRSSFFMLQLPFNWFILCCDTGNTQDIDITQRNYFLKVIEHYMDERSCVILTAHEPGWLYNAMERRDTPQQRELDYLVNVLGTRLRLRMAGDIHHYSRHTPTDVLSEAATLVVSGGGGGFLHGARDDVIISQGTPYTRSCAFPRRNTYLTITSRLWGFRLVNWKFDIFIGCSCFLLVYSLLPVPKETLRRASDIDTVSAFFAHCLALTLTFMTCMATTAKVSWLSVLFFYSCFSSAGSDRKASYPWRFAYGVFWTTGTAFISCGMLAAVHCLPMYMHNVGLLLTTEGKWGSMLEEQTRLSASDLVVHLVQLFGDKHMASLALLRVQEMYYDSFLYDMSFWVLKALDPIETLAHLSQTIGSDVIGEYAKDTTRVQIMLYYAHIIFFYWILVTPVVSFLIGIFLFVSVRFFDYMYDGVYSAFQIEDFKHFIRFRLDKETRELHAHVIVEASVPKVWELDPKHVAEYYNGGGNLAPHLRSVPSKWRPAETQRSKKEGPRKIHQLETFVIRPHRLFSQGTTAATSDN